MSLKAFHIFFIVVSTIFSAWFGLWCLREYTRTGGPGTLVLGVGAGVWSVALVFYGVWFVRKLKNVSYL